MDSSKRRPTPPASALDFDIGSIGDPYAAAEEALARRGLRISRGTLTRMRSGKTGTVRTAYRLACADALRANNAELKTAYCLRLLEAGCELRRPGRQGARVYACLGLSGSLQTALGLTRHDLHTLVRMMRADVALWSSLMPGDEIARQFREAASLFLRTNRDRRWSVLHSPTDYLGAAWDRETIHGFYHALYWTTGSITRAAWLPYEVEPLRSFYLLQQELRNPLTPLDREVLAGAIRLTPTAGETARIVRAHVGVSYGEDCLTTHRHLLVTGSPKPVSRKPGPRLP